jgi:AraC family transcriptional regulator
MLVISGRTTIESRAGGDWARSGYGPGTVAMTPPGEPTSLRWRGAERVRTVQVYVPGPLTDQVALAMYGRVSSQVRRPDALAADDPLLAHLLRALLAEVRAGVADDLYAESAATFLSAHLLRQHAGRPPALPARREDRRITKAVSYIRENLGSALSLTDMAAAASLSPYHFLRVFKAATGQTPRQYLNAMRLRHARRYLEHTDLSITEISAVCGFGTPSRLASNFRLAFGMSPSEYRRSRA